MKITITKSLVTLMAIFASTSLQAGITFSFFAHKLHDAVQAHNLPLVMQLVEQGYDINETEKHSCTPLHYAVLLSNIDQSIVKYLLLRGANIHARDKDGDTPLHWATMYRRFNTVKYIIETGGNINKKNYLGETPLYTINQHSNLFSETYLKNVASYYTDGTVITPNQQNQLTIPNYFALATIKNNLGDVKKLFPPTQTPEELQNIIDNIESMQLTNNDNSGRKLAMSLCLNDPKAGNCSFGKFGTSVKNQQNLLGFLKTKKNINSSFNFK